MPKLTPGTEDLVLSKEVSRLCEQAKVHLRREMLARGLLERDGWRLAEKVRSTDGRTELVFWPVHRSLESPSDLECIVAINDVGGAPEANCEE